MDTVKLLLDSGTDIENRDDVSTRRCTLTYMYVYMKWSMIWLNIVRRILTRWAEMRWLLIDDEDDVWIVCDFEIEYFILIWIFLMKLSDISHLCLYKNRIIFLIVSWYLLYVFVYIGWHWYLDKNVWANICQCSIWYDMIWYDILHNDIIFVCKYVWWETVLSTY